MSKKLIRFDWAMKTILRDKANFDVLEGFLAALLDDEEIKILNILESETNQLGENDKFNRVDLLVEDKDKRKIYIEIQNTRESDYLERLLYSTSKIIVENQELGKDFTDISKVISISILYFNLGTGDDYIYYGTNEFFGLNSKNKLILKKKTSIVNAIEPKFSFTEKNIFPEYYLITVERFHDDVKKKIDEWIYMIKNSEIAKGSSSLNIDKAEKKLALLNMSESEKKSYERYLINSVVERDIMKTASEDAFKKGEQQGIKKGKTDTILQVAINGIKAGLDNFTIKALTALPEKEIEELRYEINKTDNYI